MGRKKQISDQRRLYTERMRLQKGVFSSLANAAGHIGELYADFVQSDEVRNSMRATADKSVGITDKTTAAGSQLDDLALVEHLITHTLRTGMAAGRNYKDIYQDCKNRLEAMRYLQCTA